MKATFAESAPEIISWPAGSTYEIILTTQIHAHPATKGFRTKFDCPFITFREKGGAMRHLFALGSKVVCDPRQIETIQYAFSPSEYERLQHYIELRIECGFGFSSDGPYVFYLLERHVDIKQPFIKPGLQGHLYFNLSDLPLRERGVSIKEVNTCAQNIELYSKAYSFLVEHLPEGITEENLQRYFVAKFEKPESLKTVFFELIHAAQNYQFMPNVIKFMERRSIVESILHDYDIPYVAALNEWDLYQLFRSKFSVTSTDNKHNCWYKWACSIIDSARFLKTFRDFEEFDAYVQAFVNNLDTRIELPEEISRKIRGIGFALACNALKELGYPEYSKPDVHVTDICAALGLPAGTQQDVFRSMAKVADDIGVSPYKVDKVFWLICSGNYYLDNVRVPGLKAALIDCLKG